MAKDLYVRVKPKGPVTTFHRCGMLFGLLWVPLTDLDPATAERLENEQMLETSETKPEGFDDQVQETASGETVDQNTLTPDAETGLIGSGLLPSLIRYDTGFEITLGDLVQEVHTASGLSVDDWNGLAEQARETLLQVYVDQLNKRHALMVMKFKDLKDIETVRDGLQAKVNELDSQVSQLQAQLIALKPPPAPAEGSVPTADPAPTKSTIKTKAK